MANKPIEKESEILITSIQQRAMVVHVEGESPLIIHRLSRKAQQELLLPARKKNRAEKEGSAKHDILAEYRESFYLSRNADSPTACVLPAAAFKGAMMTAALDIPGAAKSQIGRLVYIEDAEVAIYGVPELYVTEVRNSGMNRTPDIRTRPIMPHWAATFTVRFTVPLLSESTVASLIAASGQLAGVGDGRPEKGKLAFGRFRVVDRERFDTLTKTLGARAEQEAAYQHPRPFDDDSSELLDWFVSESDRRGFDTASTVKRATRKAASSTLQAGA